MKNKLLVAFLIIILWLGCGYAGIVRMKRCFATANVMWSNIDERKGRVLIFGGLITWITIETDIFVRYINSQNSTKEKNSWFID